MRAHLCSPQSRLPNLISCSPKAFQALSDSSTSSTCRPPRSRAEAAEWQEAAITVADDPARDYMLSGSWALTEEGTFDSRDVVDELDAKSGNLVRGNWILTGYFDAGNCDKLLAGLGNKNAWTAPVTLWGSSWQASGGDYTFSTSLGTHPMAALCRIDGDGRGLLLQRFVVERPAGMTKAALLAELGQARVLAAAIDQRDVVGHVYRHARQHRQRIGHVAAELQHVAQDQRDAEAVADRAPLLLVRAAPEILERLKGHLRGD